MHIISEKHENINTANIRIRKKNITNKIHIMNYKHKGINITTTKVRQSYNNYKETQG